MSDVALDRIQELIDEGQPLKALEAVRSQKSQQMTASDRLAWLEMYSLFQLTRIPEVLELYHSHPLTDPSALFLVASCYHELGDYESARPILEGLEVSDAPGAETTQLT
jgi:hypothetical protein